MSVQSIHIAAVTGVLAVALAVMTALWGAGTSKFRPDISENHSDISKYRHGFSKNPHGFSKNHRDISKNQSGISKYRLGFSNIRGGSGKFRWGFSKFHGAVGQSPVLLVKGEGSFAASGQVMAQRWWAKAWDRPENMGGPSGARSPPVAAVTLDESGMRNIL